MPLREHVYSVMIVSASEKLNSSLRSLLTSPDFDPVCISGSVSEAQRTLKERSFDIILINTPLPDDFGMRFAIDVSRGQSSVAALIVKNEIYNEIYSKVVDHGVFIIRKPISAMLIQQALDWMRAARERMRQLEKKTVSLEDKMAEIRIVNHAKWALIESLKMTEADAHRFIEKQAMDRCVTRREIAENILRTYT
ncbi:MAG: ANTAR domain-containing protein [Clostridiales bacterium]|nr:ANTAR domain-containing protein [Clostridiales bacterium]